MGSAVSDILWGPHRYHCQRAEAHMNCRKACCGGSDLPSLEQELQQYPEVEEIPEIEEIPEVEQMKGRNV
jgi:hypothetical protein